MIKNDSELAATIKSINGMLEEVSRYIGPDDPEKYDGKQYMIQLPWDYLTDINKLKNKLKFIPNERLKTTISTNLRLSDIYCWLLNRTTVHSLTRKMLVQHGIILMGSVCESIVNYFYEKRFPRKQHEPPVIFTEKIKALVQLNIITAANGKELEWLWDMRKCVHIYIQYPEKMFVDKDYSRAVITAQNLIDHMGGVHRI